MLPGINGWSVLSEQKSDPELVAIPLVMIPLVDDRGLAASLKAADYILKPVRRDRPTPVMESSGSHGGGVRIVEDKAHLRLHVRALLENEGWTVADAGIARV